MPKISKNKHSTCLVSWHPSVTNNAEPTDFYRPEICYCDFLATSGPTFRIFYNYLRPQSRTDRFPLLLLPCFSLLSPSHLSRQVYYCPFGLPVAEAILSIDVSFTDYNLRITMSSYWTICSDLLEVLLHCCLWNLQVTVTFTRWF